MPGLKSILLAWKAFWQLGPRHALRFAIYQAALRLRLYRLLTPANRPPEAAAFQPLALGWPDAAALKAALGPEGQRALLAEADEIVAGQARLFGGPPRPLALRPPAPLWHWTYYKMPRIAGQDIKLTWEPARFGWATVLGRAYHASGEERYAEAFWLHTESFLTANPPNEGPNWASAQEVSLRLICLSFALSLFWESRHSTPARRQRLATALAEHAGRIPSTLIYARAQNNNHLLTEAAGLLTAAAVLPQHPAAARWQRLGWRWLNHGLQSQIAPDGTYSQHSANYHRLVLQVALWAARLGPEYPPVTRARLAAASAWLAGLLDDESGGVPNLGPNDGAYILSLSTRPFTDFRPVLQAARRAFLGEAPEMLDEMSLWLAPSPGPAQPAAPAPHLRLEVGPAWGVLRAARFSSRPGHADQLHFDLWWRGLNIALDAGTAFYNARPPWENALSGTEVHNTLTINGQPQMTRAGRFLWLDWAQAVAVEHSPARATATHDGYRAFGLDHRRIVEAAARVWQVTDEVLPQVSMPARRFLIRLHWLLPDWPWALEGATLTLQSPYGPVQVVISGPADLRLSLARAGELLAGQGAVPPTRGWHSPTYSVREPALSLAIEVQSAVPLTFLTTFTFPS